MADGGVHLRYWVRRRPRVARRAPALVALPLVAVALVAVVLIPTAGAGARPTASAGTAGTVAPEETQQVSDGPQLPADPDADPARIRRRADEILDDDRYRSPEPEGRTFLDRLREWVDDRLPNISAPGGRSFDGASILIVALVVAGAVAVTSWAVAGSRRRRWAPDDPLDSEVELTPLRTPSEWTAEAEHCEARGDHRGAVRARFRALSGALAARGLVADTAGRTAGEMRAELAQHAPAAGEPFVSLAQLFERAWFGSVVVREDDATAARTLAERVLEAAPRRAEGGPDAGDQG